MNLPSSEAVTGLILAIVGGIGGALAIWKKGSSDTLQIAENGSKKDWLRRQDERIEQQDAKIEHLLSENEKCRAENLALINRVNYLTQRSDKLAKDVHRITNLLFSKAPELKDAFGSDFGKLDERAT